ncbi:unnamed protein product [Clonostachys rosea]|uniref:Zn(2)-C6 fungal-type domain-containing protein n=1 Tax=Bionectria ochroleuca TaxID=29856 RepID=A0ABY6UG12_BIOOC|nr:unnamed protein product [Clonostachys rosea]
MPPRVSKREYRGSACHRCHKQKVKCNKEKPCRNCSLTNSLCTYAFRDRKITVPESYLKHLEGGLARPEVPHGAVPRHISFEAADAAGQRSTQDAVPNLARQRFDVVVENSTAEQFVSKLKQIRDAKSSFCAHGTQSESLSGARTEESQLPPTPFAQYEYFELTFDTTPATCTFKLPPYPYVVHLLEQFSIYLGHDWHWFRPHTFHKKVHNTYKVAGSEESKDRVWLCKLLVVLALAESFDKDRQPEITIDLHGREEQSSADFGSSKSLRPPGLEFFEQALRILTLPYENACIDHVEILNMITQYSNQLNRQKTAYMYAGISARLCNTLQLHQVASSRDCSPVEREHRKRLWWSTYCLDRMTSTQTGLPPSFQVEQTDLGYPSDAEIPLNDANEFTDVEFLTARVQLTMIEENNLKSVPLIGRDDARDIETIVRPKLRRLHTWKEGLPSHMASELRNDARDNTDSQGAKRALANLHLRYNQCLILLLRPLLLRQVGCIFSKEESSVPQDDLKELNNICLKSARTNVQIMINMRSSDLITRLGFMENMHVFASLMIMCLAMSINAWRPGSFDEAQNDVNIYEAGKDILSYMMQCGSLAAKGHRNMLKEVEDLGIAIASEAGLAVDAGNHWDIDAWMTQLFENENTLGFPEA